MRQKSFKMWILWNDDDDQPEALNRSRSYIKSYAAGLCITDGGQYRIGRATIDLPAKKKRSEPHL